MNRYSEHRAHIASQLNIAASELDRHPYHAEIVQDDDGLLAAFLIRWHDDAPEGVLRYGRRGAYTTEVAATSEAIG